MRQLHHTYPPACRNIEIALGDSNQALDSPKACGFLRTSRAAWGMVAAPIRERSPRAHSHRVSSCTRPLLAWRHTQMSVPPHLQPSAGPFPCCLSVSPLSASVEGRLPTAATPAAVATIITGGGPDPVLRATFGLSGLRGEQKDNHGRPLFAVDRRG